MATSGRGTWGGMLRANRLKPKKCQVKTCRAEYIPGRSFQTWCSIPCAEILAKDRLARKAKAEEKRARKETKARLMELKPLQYWLKRAEKACNAYIRARDHDQPCISCGTWDSLQFQAGHFIPVGRSSFLRYDESNIFKQCIQCNKHKSGNLTEYEIRLTAKIGLQAVEYLKTAPRSKDWTRDELRACEAHYRAKLKGLLAVAA